MHEVRLKKRVAEMATGDDHVIAQSLMGDLLTQAGLPSCGALQIPVLEP